MGSCTLQQEAGNKTDVQVLLTELKACCRTQNLLRGKQLHADATELGHDSSIYVRCTLINMYAKCGSMVDAHQVFDSTKHPNVISWTALILGYADNGQGLTALDLFVRMNTVGGPPPDCITFLAALKACTSVLLEGYTGCRIWGKAVHTLAMENNCYSDIYVQNTLIDMYAKCGSMADGHQVFDSIKHPDVVSWNALIMGYAENGQGLNALALFTRMKNQGLPPDSGTFVASLKACISLTFKGTSGWTECRNRGIGIHALALEIDCDLHIYVKNTLMDMYAKCGSMADARLVFNSLRDPNTVSWNMLILGYAANGEEMAALESFTRMKSGDPPNSITFVAVLKACASLALNKRPSELGECRVWGKAIHDLSLANGCNSDIYVQSTLIDMYAKCGSMVEARQAFDSMKHRNVVSWTALILGYVENGECVVALDMFEKMKWEGVSPNSLTLVVVLKACGLLGALEFGRTIHSQIESGNELNVFLVNCLVDFYAKCGVLEEAQSVFDMNVNKTDVITWNALLAGFSGRGDHISVFKLFQRMQDLGSKPDSVTFLCILGCCSHAGFVQKGKECFDTMSMKYGIVPNVEHYNCMIDILGRANRLDDAVALLRGMFCTPNEVTWKTVLAVCRKWKNVELGRLAFQALVALNDRDGDRYVLMGQIYEREMITKMS